MSLQFVPQGTFDREKQAKSVRYQVSGKQMRGRMVTSDELYALSDSSLFRELDLQVRLTMARRMSAHHYSAGEIIVMTGEPCRVVYLIAKGQVRIQHLSPEGREYVLHTIGSGQSFNLEAAIDGGYTLATASALTDTDVYGIPVDVFRQVLNEHPRVALALLEHLAQRVRRLCYTVENLAFHTVRTRLARCLLSLADGASPVARYMSQAELAVHIGTVRDVVGRTLCSFAQEGLVRRERGRVVITDRDGLQREALRDQDLLGQDVISFRFGLPQAVE